MDDTKASDSLTLRESRKTFIPSYFLSAALASVMIYLKAGDYDLSGFSLMLGSGVILFGLLLPEAVRRWQTCVVKSDKIELTTGIIKKKHRKFFTKTITDIHLSQNLWQRIWGYGTIKVSSFAEDGELRLGSVDRPRKKIEKIEEIFGKEVTM